jgi:hypothetical protein
MPRYSTLKIQNMLMKSDNATTPAAKGAMLEQLIRYLFEKIPGISFVEKNILDSPRAHEIDLAFTNRASESELFFLDAVIIVECKHTQTPVGSEKVRWFIDKLVDRGSSNGILVSLTGITGSPDCPSSAYSEITNALTRDKVIIILIEREEILDFTNTNDITDLMSEKYLRLKLHRAV